nr:proline--tRNA ligase, cytoplasmic-like [Ipomoea batatas]GMC62827.1 proline--tRNA ligase, cytoplasmic-like [Ipomoea batatas]
MLVVCIIGGVLQFILLDVEKDVKARTKGEMGTAKTLCSPFDQPELLEVKEFPGCQPAGMTLLATRVLPESSVSLRENGAFSPEASSFHTAPQDSCMGSHESESKACFSSTLLTTPSPPSYSIRVAK